MSELSEKAKEEKYKYAQLVYDNDDLLVDINANGNR
jgi:hypothetical protein